jgi:hypothetical protein
MLSLKSVREMGKAMEQAEARIRENSSLEQRVRTFLGLYRASLPFYSETKNLFLQERVQHLTALQKKLQKLEEWQQKKHGNDSKSI